MQAEIKVTGPIDLKQIEQAYAKREAKRRFFGREVIWAVGETAWRGRFAGAAVEAGIIFLIFDKATAIQVGLLSSYGGVPVGDAYWAA